MSSLNYFVSVVKGEILIFLRWTTKGYFIFFFFLKVIFKIITISD